MIKRSAFLLLFLVTMATLRSQSAQDAAVALRADVDTAALSITLDWPNPAVSTILLKRRKKGQAGNQWTTLLNLANSTVSTYTDTSLEKGSTYEYAIRRFTTFNAYGFAQVAILAPVVDYRGKILIFIDSTTADATGVELKKFKDGIRGDGWQTVPIKTGPSSTVQSIKSRIVSEYNADPDNVKAVLLIGEVPIPYSGNSAWDGHSDHNGAWPCDNYYADVNGNWTDAVVNVTNPGRDANDNVPGDGKFDQSVMPSAAELMVGRIDFRRLNAATFGATPTELIERYFIKNRKWRTKQYTVEYRALIDDNFGYFGGEAFAANGYRNAYPLVGADNVENGDLLTGTDSSTYLMSYGCGGGSYNSASGVGNSNQVAADSLNFVFSNIFGSYHGDWDYESNPLMPSFLAAKGGVLTCSWAGRPHWFMQGLACGETIGFCTKETLNAQFNTEYVLSGSFGTSGAHVALLGDPTVRAHIVAPVPVLSAESTCTAVGLKWAASPDTGILGYHVYRSLTLDGPYHRLTDQLVDGLNWSDTVPVPDTVFYQVRPVRIDHAPGGGYFYNAGTGIILQHAHSGAPAVTLDLDYPMIDCYYPCVHLLPHVDAAGQPVQFYISGPATPDTSLAVCVPGTYSLVAENTSNGCTAQVSVTVEADFSEPLFAETITPASAAGASDGAIHLQIPDGATYNFFWSTGAISQHVTGLPAGVYSVTVRNAFNGCSRVQDFQVGITTGTGETPAVSDWTLTPNPAGQYINIRVPASHFGEVLIFDVQGNVRVRKTISSSTTTIDISSLGAGVYMACRSENGKMLSSRYFIKI